MVERLTQEIFIEEAPEFSNLKDDLELVTEIISLLWYRGVYGCNPPLKKLRRTKSLVGLELITDAVLKEVVTTGVGRSAS